MEADKTGDHPPPKRPMSVYNCFVRAKTKELTSGGKTSAPEAMKAAAAAYKAAEPSELAPYAKEHEEDKRRYEK